MNNYTWYDGQRVLFPCLSCGRITSTTMTPSGRKNSSGECHNCRLRIEKIKKLDNKKWITKNGRKLRIGRS